MCLAVDVGRNRRQKKQHGVHEVEVAEDGAMPDGSPSGLPPPPTSCPGPGRARCPRRRWPHAPRLHIPPPLLPRPTTSKIAPTISGSRAFIWRRCSLYNAARGRRFNQGAHAHIVASRGDTNPVSWCRRGVFYKIYSVETSSVDPLYMPLAFYICQTFLSLTEFI